MSKKILIITGDAGESFEVLYGVHRFREAGWEPVVAAPDRRTLHLVMHDFEPGWDTYIERQGYRVTADIAFDDVNVEDYEAIMIPGGRAPEYLRNNARLLDIVRAFKAQDRWIFAICHGAQVLVSAGLAGGMLMTAYEHVRYEIEAAGGTYGTEQAVRDGKMVTGQTWQSHPEFYRLVFACLEALEPVGAD